MIPHEKNDAVIRGLREAFGVDQFDDIRAITKGQTTALVYRIVVGGSPYLLKIITRPYQMIGPDRLFTCMQSAAEAGIAPRVLYQSVADGIWITDFVEEIAFTESEARRRMPELLRVLHALPPFPRTENHINTTCTFLLHAGPARDGFFRAFQASNVVTPEAFEQLVAWHAQLVEAYPHDDVEADMLSSHNDLFKPDNILFDGARVWLVDWEAAFLNDRYADLAAVANLLFTSEEEQGMLLNAYFGKPANEHQLARFYLMRQTTHMFYGMAFQLLGASSGGEAGSEEMPSSEAFRRRMWAGEINLADKAAKITYGRVHWNEMVKNAHTSRHTDALRISASSKVAKSAQV
jgi:thiamine kinase-like enzyme